MVTRNDMKINSDSTSVPSRLPDGPHDPLTPLLDAALLTAGDPAVTDWLKCLSRSADHSAGGVADTPPCVVREGVYHVG
jgi:hypothetical protein